MEEGVEQVNYFKTGVLMISKTGSQLALPRSQLNNPRSQQALPRAQLAKLFGVPRVLCVAAAVLGSSPVPLVKPPEAPWLPPPLRKQA